MRDERDVRHYVTVTNLNVKDKYGKDEAHKTVAYGIDSQGRFYYATRSGGMANSTAYYDWSGREEVSLDRVPLHLRAYLLSMMEAEPTLVVYTSAPEVSA